MSDFDDFERYYKSLSDRQIIEILRDNPDRYQQAALLSAKKEFDRRRLNEKKIELEVKETSHETEPHKNKSLFENEKISRVYSKAEEIVDLLQPFQEEKPGSERLINVFSIIWGAAGLYYLYNIAIDINRVFDEFFFSPVYYTFAILVPAIIISTSILFWKRKQIGWILFVLLTLFSIPPQIKSIILFIDFNNQTDGLGKYALRYSINLATTILSLIFYGFTLNVVYRKDFTNIYRISKNKKEAALAFGILLSLLLFLFF